jgi:hypothetical protein
MKYCYRYIVLTKHGRFLCGPFKHKAHAIAILQGYENGGFWRDLTIQKKRYYL